MKQIDLTELKKIELGTLIYIDEICRAHGLRYSLCGGTLLGAVRHQGFIPWDDDIDIMMPRPDYERFLEIMKNADGRYKILSPAQEDYYYNFSKVIDTETMLSEHNCQPIKDMGVYVDVFPLDGMPSDAAERDNHFARLYRIRRRINNFCLLKPKPRKHLIKYGKALYLYARNTVTKPQTFQKKYETLAKQNPYDDAEYILMSGGAYGKKEMFPKDFAKNFIELPFEKRSFLAIEGYEAYLTHIYGNYMQLPPEEKRVARHHFTAKYKKENGREE